MLVSVISQLFIIFGVQFMVPTSSTKNAQGSGSNSKLSASLHDLKRALAVPTSVKSTNVIQRINSLLPTSTL